MLIKKIEPKNFKHIVNLVVEILKTGGVAVLPFDTVYGFICDAGNETAIRKIYQLKGRDFSKPLGLVLADLESMEQITRINFATYDYIKKRVPGKFTFILPLKSKAGIAALTYRDRRVAVRIPNSSLVQALADRFTRPLAQTSANKAGQTNCGSISELKKQFSGQELAKISLIIDGGIIKTAKPSEIIDLTGTEPRRIERN